ncbi:MAG: tyrosine-type recombinase/integrase [Colwellia sp.]|nr:tyrosine-type recombinase/integrase [Colwellia sp.]
MLTVPQIKGFKPKNNPYYKWDVNGERGTGKLAVQITPKGSKQFVFRYFKDGKAKFIQLEKHPECSLSDARKQATAYGALLKKGLDPKEVIAQTEKDKALAKKVEAQKGSIKQLFVSYTAQMEKDGKRTYKAVLSSLEKEVYPYISQDTKAKDVTAHDVIIVLSNMIKRDATTQSNRVRSYLMAAFNYGLKHDNDPANYIDEAKFGLAYNPVAGIPKQKAAERIGEHYLSKTEVKQLLHDLKHEYYRFKMGDNIRNLLQLTLYTGGQRPYELVASKWESVNWEEKTLLITSDISKNKRLHIIPLTESAILVLKEQKLSAGDSDFIFPHRFDLAKHIRPDSLSQAISRYRDNTEIRSFIPRDIRRTCKTLMGELGISKTIRDRLQNHALQDVSSKHYDRYEYLPEKRIALESWEQQLNNTITSNVIALGGK